MSNDKLVPQEDEYKILARGLQDDLPIYMSNQMNAGIYLNHYRAEAIKEQLRKISINEYRLFKTYHSHIDPANSSTRLVKIQLDEYLSYMGLAKDTRRSRILEDLTNLKARPYRIKTPIGVEEYILFDYTALTEPDKLGKSYIVMKCSEVALPLFFFSDPNVNKNLHLLSDGTVDRSTIPPYTQLRLGTAKKANKIAKDAFFALMSQYRKIGHFTISVIDFVDRIFGPEFIGVDKLGMQTPVFDWTALRRKIQTFIPFARSEGLEVTFKPAVRSGTGGKIKSITFEIETTPEFKGNAEADVLTGSVGPAKTPDAVFEQMQIAYYDEDEYEREEREREEMMALEETCGRFRVSPPELGKDDVLAYLAADELFKDLTFSELKELSICVCSVPIYKLPKMEHDTRMNRYHFLRQLKSRADSDESRGRIKKNKFSYLIGMIKNYQEKDNE